MADVLERIVARKRAEISARLGGRPVAAEPSRRSLREVLGRPGARFIMEVKMASPSGHRARVGLDQALAAYAPVADALSILTDGPDFGGSLDDLRAARQGFDGPILAKDFIVDPAQVSEARSAGADAVLAMMSVLDDVIAAQLLAEADRLGMDVIVEVHDEHELGRALALGAAVIGINNRDLKTLKTDLSVTERLAPLIPSGVLVIGESGISSRRDVDRLAPLVDAFLVGSSLMASNDIADASRALVHGRVKLCGLTRGEDVTLALKAGATHAGFVFVPATPRLVDQKRARDLTERARQSGLKSVGVFRNAEEKHILGAVDRLGLDAVQLHGSESAEAISTLRSALPVATELWGMCGVGTVAAPGRPGVDRLLFDTVEAGVSGGTGRPFDWSLLEGRAEITSAFLAGGIGPNNAEAASKVGAYGLDVGSSVEVWPGIKDAGKVSALFAALRPSGRARP